MSWEGIDHELNRVRGEADRITLNLADLDAHVGHQLLKGAALEGRTRRRWEHADAHVHTLWTVYDAFRLVVDEATRLRAAGAGPGAQAALTALLNGPSVVLPVRHTPLGERGLLDADEESVTLADAVARMTAAYEEATGVISAVEAAWDVLNPRLGELDAMWQETGTLSDMVGLGEDEEDGYEALRSDLAAVGATVRTDPLSLVEDGRVDTSDLDRLRQSLERVRGELRDALRMRDSYTESVERLGSAIDDVEEAVARARGLRARVVAKVSSPAAVEVPDPVQGLRAGLGEMDSLRARGRWRELGTRLGELQRAVHEAADDARDREDDLAGLMERRAELRGRLQAFRARAVRLGLAEDERLAGLHDRAHTELWTAPCDLRAATVFLSSYLRALRELGGTETPGDRTTPGTGASDGESDGGVSR
ncbi:hypothetical protein ACIRPH_20940 [Nocardiopsis sp. NPDC101807]|uniref:hypothetical protein n=1 Tax=Nocardiopsis sp. NPDC101807 TaxID=3364339 RepID=UPI0038041523